MAHLVSQSFIARELSGEVHPGKGGWSKSTANLLERLDVMGPRITIRRRDGTVDELEQGRFNCISYRTGSGRRLFVIKYGDDSSTRFLEVENVLPPADWDAIAEALKAVPSGIDVKHLCVGVAIILGWFAAAITTGVISHAFELPAEMTVLWSPLSLGLMAAWIAGLWVALKHSKLWG